MTFPQYICFTFPQEDLSLSWYTKKKWVYNGPQKIAQKRLSNMTTLKTDGELWRSLRVGSIYPTSVTHRVNMLYIQWQVCSCIHKQTFYIHHPSICIHKDVIHKLCNDLMWKWCPLINLILYEGVKQKRTYFS